MTDHAPMDDRDQLPPGAPDPIVSEALSAQAAVETTDDAASETALDAGSDAGAWPAGVSPVPLDRTPVPPAAPTAITPPVRSRGSRIMRRVLISLAAMSIFVAGVDLGRGTLPVPSLIPPTPHPVVVPASLPPEFAKYVEAWQVIHDDYVGSDELDDESLIDASINGLTEAVGDTGHTRFLTAKELEDQHQSLSGSIVGIGAVLDGGSSDITIRKVIPGGPAERAGLQADDRITTVDGVPTSGKSVSDVVLKVRGEEGSTVVLTVERPGETSPLHFSIVRERFSVPNVTWTIVPGTSTAMIRIESFTKGVDAQLEEAIAAAHAAGSNGIILDLRSNPGGYVGEAVDVVSEFVRQGKVFTARDADGETEDSQVTGDGLAFDEPLVVLVDEQTASASEIVTGALQDAGRATVIGQKTFGAGTVLTEYPLTEGGALMVGTVEWLTRDGHEIWKVGITPQVEVSVGEDAKALAPDQVGEITPGDVETTTDPWLKAALETLSAR